MRWLTYARFEVINEILMHRIALQTKRVLVQCRVFGESPQPLTAEQARQLLTLILDDVKSQFAPADAGGWEESMAQLVDETLYGTPDRQLASAGRPSTGGAVPNPRGGVPAVDGS